MVSQISSNAGSFGQGVYYSAKDYAGFATRMVILAVDGAVLLLPLVVVLAIIIVLVVESAITPDAAGPLFFCYFVIWLQLAFLYLTVLEKSSWGTLGMILTRTRIVNLRGETPSFVRMVFRLMLWGFGPIHPLWDALWMTGDDYRQTLRDKLAGTYVVRKGAVPIGSGRVRYRHLHVFALNLPHLEVDRGEHGQTRGGAG